jgi:hypothetical protein
MVLGEEFLLVSGKPRLELDVAQDISGSCHQTRPSLHHLTVAGANRDSLSRLLDLGDVMVEADLEARPGDHPVEQDAGASDEALGQCSEEAVGAVTETCRLSNGAEH